MSESEMDNILVRQKDRIIRLINAMRLNEAFAALNVVRDLWQAMSYGYKIREIEQRIAQADETWSPQDYIRNSG